MTIFLPCAISACGSTDDSAKDLTMPTIEDTEAETSPTDCEEFHRGDTIFFAYNFSDDTELGSFNIEAHNNFDHHTHSTSAVECEQEDKKQPVRPWTYSQDFQIPPGTASYAATL